MTVHKKFVSVARKINTALDRANARALNRAADSGKVEAVRLISADLGLTSKVIRNRIRTGRAKIGTDAAVVSFGIKARFFLDDFSATIKNVKTKQGIRQAVSVKVGTGGRVRVPGLFPILVTGSRSKAKSDGVSTKNFIGIQRKGASRLPTERPVFNNYIPTIRKHTRAIQRAMVNAFQKNQAYYLNEQMKKLK